jgi:hypothetical protein
MDITLEKIKKKPKAIQSFHKVMPNIPRGNQKTEKQQQIWMGD